MATIAIDIRVLTTGRRSGVEEYTERLLEHLLPPDDGTEFILFSAGRQAPPERPWMRLPHVRSVHIGGSNRLLMLRTRLTGAPLLDREVGGADAFFFPHFLLGATSSACRRIMTWHDLSYESMPELLDWRRLWWHRFQMQPRRQAAAVDHIIAVSESTRRDLLANYALEPERISVVHSGVDAALTRPSEGDLERFRLRMGLPRRFILSLATREPRKNHDALLTAFERLAEDRRFDDVQLLLVGPCGWRWGSMTRRISASSVRTRIRVVDGVEPGERPYWLGAAAVLAYPSLLEGFGFPPLEAMACGTPVVAAASSSMLEVAGDAAMLADPYRPAQLAAALAGLLTDEPLRERCIRRGRERARAFSWERTAARTREILLAACTAPRMLY